MPRPLIGLALGSGAARGWAHIGIIRALAAAGIKPDVVAGTSVGALVGGVHLAGHLDTLEQWALGLSRLNMLRYLDFRVSGGGLIGGERLVALLDEHLGERMIDELPARFAAVAADLRTGHEIWVTQGRIVDALRASFSLPGLFKPHHVGGQWLVDGALVNPIPVSVCRALGANMVITANLNSDIIGKHRKRSADTGRTGAERAARAEPTPADAADDDFWEEPSALLDEAIDESLAESAAASVEGANAATASARSAGKKQRGGRLRRLLGGGRSESLDESLGGALGGPLGAPLAAALGARRPLLRQIFRSQPSMPSVFSVMVASLNIVQDRLGRSRLAGDPPDVAITPKLGHIGLLEFNRAEEAIAEGVASVERALPDIEAALDVLSG